MILHPRCFIVFLLLSLSTWAEEPVRALRVMTYNIHHGEGVDGKLDLERIAKVILSEKPDLVALQEVDQNTKRTRGVDQVAKLGELTSMHPAFGKALSLQGGGYGVAMLSHWPLENVATHALPADAGTEPRAALSATVTAGDKGPKIQFIVTHVDHREDATARIKQVAKLRELFPPSDAPAILAADFNDTPESEVIRGLLAEWTDTAAGQKLLTYPSNPPTSKIDYILVRPAAKWRVVETKVVEEAVASDHRPMVTVLEGKY